MSLLKIKRFIKSEDGPTSVEYAVMLALIIAVCMATIDTLGKQTSTSFNNPELANTLSGGQ